MAALPEIKVPEPKLQLARRYYVYVLTMAMLLLLREALVLGQETKWLIGATALIATLYITAVAAEHLVQISSNAGIMRAVASVSAAVTSVADAVPGVVSTVKTTVGAGAAQTTTETTTTTADPPKTGAPPPEE